VEFQKDRITGCVKNEPYYYVDFADVKVRAICLMSNYREDGKDYYGVYKEQVDWLAQDALLAPDGWHILLFTHIGPVEGLGYVSHSNDNITEFAAFLTAFQNKEKFASSVFSVDFRNAGTAKIVAMFVGHGHTDWILKPGILPCYLVETGSSLSHMPKRETWTMPADAVVPKREYNTVTEDIWDAVVFNPQKGTLDMIRFGAGDDRHIDL